METNLPEFIQVKEAAALLGRSKGFIRKLGDRGYVEMFRDPNAKNKRRAFKTADLLAFKNKFHTGTTN